MKQACRLQVFPQHFNWIKVRTVNCHSKTLILYFFNHSLVEQLVCFEPLSCCMTTDRYFCFIFLQMGRNVFFFGEHWLPFCNPAMHTTFVQASSDSALMNFNINLSLLRRYLGICDLANYYTYCLWSGGLLLGRVVLNFLHLYNVCLTVN